MFDDIQVPAVDETHGGYASGPEELEHSSVLPISMEQSVQPLIIGKKRRRRNKKPTEEDCPSKSGQSSQRKKKEITNCEHVDRDFYAKGMCKNCYHKKGRTKPASCCPDKKMYSLNLCQNCYMKRYGKEKRKENKNAKAAARMAIINLAPPANNIAAEKVGETSSG